MDGPSLPRSVRWRLQLGVWKLPHKDEGELQWTLEEILERNHDLIEIQRGNYNLLVEMLHELMEQEEQEQVQEQQQEESITLDVDPLTALVQERDAQAQRLHDLDLKYRKQRARRKRGVAECDSDRGDTYSVSHVTDMHITMHTTRVH